MHFVRKVESVKKNPVAVLCSGVPVKPEWSSVKGKAVRQSNKGQQREHVLIHKVFPEKLLNRVSIPFLDAHFLHLRSFRVQQFDRRMLSGDVFDCQLRECFRSVTLYEGCRKTRSDRFRSCLWAQVMVGSLLLICQSGSSKSHTLHLRIVSQVTGTNLHHSRSIFL